MATSNSVNFTMNRNEIITDVLESLNVKSPNEAAVAADIVSCARKLNMMVKSWMKQGMHLWAMSEATLFLNVDDATYDLGSTADHCTNTYVHTTLSTAEASGSTSLGITSATGMSASDNIGIVLDDGTIHWTTISGAPGTTTTIATGLASAAAAGNVVFAYTTKINRPLRIISAYRRDISNADIPVEIISRTDYANLSNKTTSGKAIQIFYNPQLTNGILSVWPRPDLATDVLRFWYERPLEDFDASTDSPDFPIEWAEAICTGLEYRMAPVYGLTQTEINERKERAIVMLDLAMSFDKENTSVFFQPDFR